MQQITAWLPATKIAEILGYTTRHVWRLAQKGGWQSRERKEKGGGHEYHISDLPEKVHEYIAARIADEQRAAMTKEERAEMDELWAWFENRPKTLKTRAKKRLEIVKTMNQLRGEKKLTVKAAAAETGNIYGMSERSVRRLRQLVLGHNEEYWLPLLCPKNVGRTVVSYSNMPQEAWDFFIADYLRLGRRQKRSEVKDLALKRTGPPTLSACYERLCRAATTNGWKIPSKTTLKRRIKREVPPAVLARARQGNDALHQMYPFQTRDKTVFLAGQAINGDGFKFAAKIVNEKGEIYRPVAWVWQDIYSGKIMAYRMDVSENADLIRLAWGDLIETYGIPQYAYIDNTMAAANKWITGRARFRHRFKIKEDEPLGIIPQLGCEVCFVKPASGSSKPIERQFGWGGLSEVVDKHPAIEGRGTEKRPVPQVEFEELVASEIAVWNARIGRRSAICAGRSYDETFAESYKKTAPRMPNEVQRRLWLLKAEKITAHQKTGGIEIHGNRYWNEKLGAFTKFAGCESKQSRQLIARFDPQNLKRNIFVYTLDGRFICEAEYLPSIGFNDTDTARAHERDRAAFKKNARKQETLTRRMTAREAAKLLPTVEADAPEPPKIISPIFQEPFARPDEEPIEDVKMAVNADFNPFADDSCFIQADDDDFDADTAFKEGIDAMDAMFGDEI